MELEAGAIYPAMELMLFAVLVLLCGFTLYKFTFLKVPSQVVFGLATLFIYVEFCTSYAGWYLHWQ